jgi:ATP-dependent Clp protease ATP-binding subunit ClpA
LVEAGYDPRLGARPMRRVIQRSVENIVAKKMLAKSVAPGSTVEIGLEEIKSMLDKKKQADDIGGETSLE